MVRPGHLRIDRASPFVKELLRSSGLEQLLGDTSQTIESVLHETRVLPPPADFAARARFGSMDEHRRLHAESLEDSGGFWGRQAREHLVWTEPWTEVLRWDSPDARWFVGGRLNACANVLDRHLDGPNANKAAILWEGEPAGSDRPGEERVLTYRQLHREVCLFASVLKTHGVGKGDRVVVYLPMVPEAVVAMLACARIGAIHSVIFAGFSAEAIADDRGGLHDPDAPERRGRLTLRPLPRRARPGRGERRRAELRRGRPARRGRSRRRRESPGRPSRR